MKSTLIVFFFGIKRISTKIAISYLIIRRIICSFYSIQILKYLLFFSLKITTFSFFMHNFCFFILLYFLFYYLSMSKFIIFCNYNVYYSVDCKSISNFHQLNFIKYFSISQKICKFVKN